MALDGGKIRAALDAIAAALRACQLAASQGKPVEARQALAEAVNIVEAAINVRDGLQEATWRRIQREPESDHDEARSARAQRAPRTRELRKTEQSRQRLFALTRPDILLSPANIVTVYLHQHSMWTSWSWDDTRRINERMLALLRRTDPDMPLPDEPGVAVPMTAAGYRALHLEPGPDLIRDIYREVVEGIVTVDRLVNDAVDRKLHGELSETLLMELISVADFAHLLLLHAVRFGLEVANDGVILPCKLGPACLAHAPFYVNKPGALRAKLDRHAACRKAVERARKKRPATVTTIAAKKKK